MFEFVALVVLLVVFGRFALKTRLVNSLQFQLFVFLLVLVIAEIPRALWDIGLMDRFVYSQFGLPFHALSMVLLAVFVVFRFVRGSLRWAGDVHDGQG